MPAPAARYEILPARGTKANLDAAIADIAENELCYATDEEALYIKVGGVLIPASGSGNISYGITPPVDAEQGDLWYDTNDARLFVYTGTEWADASPDAGNPTVITSDSAPGAPQDGDLWFRTSDGRMYVYYDDGASSQWVDANPATGASNWNYDGTTLTPGTAGTDVDLGTGDLSANSADIGSGNITLNADGSGTFSGNLTTRGNAFVGLNGETGAVDNYIQIYNTYPANNGVHRAFALGASSQGRVADSTNSEAYFYVGSSLRGGATTPVFTVDIDGTTKIGGTLPASPNITLQADGIIRSVPTYNNTSSSSNNVGISSGGAFYRSTSSRRFKTGIETIQDEYADAILGCRPVYYRSTCEMDNPTLSHWGFIAEEVAEIDPRLVVWGQNEDGSDRADGVNYERFVPLLLNLIQRQQARIEALESANAALEARLSILEGN